MSTWNLFLYRICEAQSSFEILRSKTSNRIYEVDILTEILRSVFFPYQFCEADLLAEILSSQRKPLKGCAYDDSEELFRSPTIFLSNHTFPIQSLYFHTGPYLTVGLSDNTAVWSEICKFRSGSGLFWDLPKKTKEKQGESKISPRNPVSKFVIYHSRKNKLGFSTTLPGPSKPQQST